MQCQEKLNVSLLSFENYTCFKNLLIENEIKSTLERSIEYLSLSTPYPKIEVVAMKLECHWVVENNNLS